MFELLLEQLLVLFGVRRSTGEAEDIMSVLVILQWIVLFDAGGSTGRARAAAAAAAR
jgi:hypothetical protein